MEGGGGCDQCCLGMVGMGEGRHVEWTVAASCACWRHGLRLYRRVVKILTADDRASLPSSRRTTPGAVRFYEEGPHRGPRHTRNLYRADDVELHDRLVLLHVSVGTVGGHARKKHP